MRYRSCQFPFDQNDATSTMVSPKEFWEFVAEVCPELAALAIKLYSVVPNTAGLERSFSVHSVLHTKKRNRLKSDRVFKMVKIKAAFVSGRMSQNLDGLPAKRHKADIVKGASTTVDDADRSQPPGVEEFDQLVEDWLEQLEDENLDAAVLEEQTTITGSILPAKCALRKLFDNGLEPLMLDLLA
jgi:hypothetical protein